MVLGAGILGLIGWGAYTVMPYIANLMENTFYAIGFGLLAVGLIYAFVIDGTLRNRMWLMYKLMMRALTYSIIKYDPFGVLRETQAQAKERIKTVDECRVEVKKQVGIVTNTLEGFKRDRDQLQGEANWLRTHNGSQAEIDNRAMKLGKIADAITRMTKTYTLTQGFYEQLTKAFEALKTIDGNIDFEINLREREYKAATASNTAWRAVKAAFNGSDQMDELRNDALAFLAEDYGAKIGEIESFMEDSQKFIASVDLQNAIYTDSGMKMLEDLTARDLSVVHTQTALPNAQPAVIIPSSNSSTGVDYSIYKK
jgi:hypothetical protein